MKLVKGKNYRVLTYGPNIWQEAEYVGHVKPGIKSRGFHDFRTNKGLLGVLHIDIEQRVMNEEEYEEYIDNEVQPVVLNEKQTLIFIKHWYLKGKCPDIFQNENGEDLEEYLEKELYV